MDINRSIEFFTGTRVESKNVHPQPLSDDLKTRERLRSFHSKKFGVTIEDTSNNITTKKEVKNGNQISKKLLVFLFLLTIVAIPLIYIFRDEIGQLLNSDKDDIIQISDLAAEVIYTEGTVLVSSDGVNWIESTSGSTLFEGYLVQTTDISRVIIAIDDGSAIRLDSNSEIQFTSMDPNNIEVELLSGKLYSRVAELERKFTIKTEKANYSALGTAYLVETTDDIEKLDVYSSAVEVDHLSRSTSIDEGKRYITFDRSGKYVSGDIRDIDLNELSKDMFVMWNKEKDSQNTSFNTEMGILKDLNIPMLTITAPKNDLETVLSEIRVSGKTTPDITIKVNDVLIATRVDGGFDTSVLLSLGKNLIEIIATNQAGVSKIEILTVYRSEQITEIPDPVPPLPGPAPTTGIVLTGEKVENGVLLEWEVTGLDTTNGFKVTKGIAPNPTYGINPAVYINKSTARSYIWDIRDGETYHFRVCLYNPTNGTCTNYSNNVQIQAPYNPDPLDSITLFTLDGLIKWVTQPPEYTGTGFIVYWSSEEIFELGDEGVGTQTLNMPLDKYLYDFSANREDGTYYIRVCGLVQEQCIEHSNTVSLTIPLEL